MLKPMSRQATIFNTTYEICGYQPNHAEPLINPPKATRRKERRNTRLRTGGRKMIDPVIREGLLRIIAILETVAKQNERIISILESEE